VFSRCTIRSVNPFRRASSPEDRAACRVEPFPPSQHQMVDWLGLMHRQHTVHALLEVDVTDARRALREHRARTGEGLSFTAFVVASLARAVDEDRRMHAYRRGRRLFLFDDVDVTVLVETDVEGARIPFPHIVRAANRKPAGQIHDEIRVAQAAGAPYEAGRRWLPLWLLVPGFLRERVWAMVLANPRRRKRLTGTVAVTSIGMFGRGTAWAIPLTSYSLCLTVGGIARKPGVVAGVVAGEPGEPGAVAGSGRVERIEVREMLALTVSVDHDVIDGAPAARFGARLVELIEGAAALA
jgi:pyruvate/2-oxoglutarate dehydrogenase complex dihydrolipoamide acyltransferase (E2) component